MKICTFLNTAFVSGIFLSKSKRFFSIIAFTLLSYISFGQVNIVFDPTTTNVTLGQTFTVDVNVEFISGEIDAAAIFFDFDNTRLAVTSATNAPSTSILPTVSFPLQSVSTMNSNGRVSYVAGTSSGFPTTNFTVISVTFTTLQAGSTSLTFRRPPTGSPNTEATRSAVSVLSGVTNATITVNAVGCTTPLATISAPGGTTTCNSQPFSLMLASASNGTGPFDLTIEGPGGTATYNNIAVGSPITTFTPPVEKIWPDIITPAPASDYFAAYTLGMKFTSSVGGFVKGVRFFSAELVSSVPGDYTGQLWSESGDLLASGTFTGVVVDSWHELLFTDPVLITPGTIYIASYSTGTSNGYAGTTDGLAADVTNGSLTAIGNGSVFSVNSVTPVTFPISPSNDNYWVDVVFSPNQYTFNLTGVTDDLGCTNTGALQTLAVTSVDCDALPVSLLNLSATPRDNSILLAWSTASEINNKGFEIQRKTGTGDWSFIGFVNGAGTSNSTRNYNHIDEKLSAARYYYRLRQVDIDGRFEYSPVVSAIIGGAEKFSLEQNYPNPFRSETVVRFTLPQKANVKLTLFDMHGRIVKTLVNGSKEKGTHAVTVNASALSSGLYYYRLESDNFSEVKKMTIQ